MCADGHCPSDSPQKGRTLWTPIIGERERKNNAEERCDAVVEKRMTFNEDAANYDRWRPRYCAELFGSIIAHSMLDGDKCAVEIGCGTGQATEPFLKTGCAVTAVELGESLAQFAKAKFADYPNFKARNVAFKDFQYEKNSVDLIYSATAFHWIPAEIGYPKAFDMLKNGGTLALFWNRPGREKDDLHERIEEIYTRYTACGKRQKDEVTVRPPAHGQGVMDTIVKHGFQNAHYCKYYNTRVFSSRDYLSLLDTYSDNIAMQPADRAQFYGEIAAVIDDFGGSIDIHDTMHLYLARKP